MELCAVIGQLEGVYQFIGTLLDLCAVIGQLAGQHTLIYKDTN
jgi:hypothetical protein